MAVAFGAGKQLVEGDVHHYAGHGGEAYGIDYRRPEWQQYRHTHYGAKRFGQPGEKRVAERLATVARGLINGNRHCYPFRNVVYGDGNDYGQRHVDAVEGGDECRHAFREIVYAYGYGEHDAGAA